jgi:putative MFS transporter
MAPDFRAATLAARLNRLPTSRVSIILVLFAAGALVVEALDIGALSVILPGIKALWHLKPKQVGVLAAASAFGVAIGMIPGGRLADRFGRKKLLVGGVLWFCTGTLLSAASPNYDVLVMLRCLSGLGMAPAFIMPYSIVSEFVAAKTRSGFAGLLETALGIGYLLPPLLGLAVMPHFAPDVAWRVFLVIAGLPVVYVAAIIRYLPESPRWLSRVGRYDEADRIVSAIERRVEAATRAGLPQPVLAPETLAGVAVPPLGTLAALQKIWQPPYLVSTVTMILGAFSTFAMFYVGVNYIPSLFIAHHMAITGALLFTFITAAVQIPGKILNGFLSDIVGRKAVYLMYTIPAAIGAYEFGQASGKWALLGWASLFLFCAGGAAPSYKMWYAEQFPTPIRATGQSTVEAIGGRLMGGVVWTFLFPVIVAGYGLGTTMTWLAGIAVAAGIVVVLFAPETMGRSVEALEAGAAGRTSSEAASAARKQPV